MESDFAEHSAKVAAIASQTVLVIIGFFSNVILLRAIWRHTPATLKNYSYILVLTSINDTICIVCDSLLIQRVIPTPRIFGQVWHGACFMISKQCCFNIFSIYLHTYTNSLALIAISFWYRRSVLQSAPSSARVAVIVAALYIPSFVQMVTLPLSTVSDSDIKAALFEYYPRLDFDNGPITGNAAQGNIYADYASIFSIMMPIPCYVYTLTTRSKASTMYYKSKDLSNLRTHKSALTYHACLPICNVFANLIVTLMLLNMFRHPLLENFVFFFASIPSCLSPIVTIVFVRPYREVVLRASRKLRGIEQTGTVTTISKQPTAMSM